MGRGLVKLSYFLRTICFYNQVRIKKSLMLSHQALFCLLAQYSYVACLRTFRTLFNCELDLLSFLQVLVTIAGNSGEMDENVLSTFAFDEAEAFVTIEPLYCTDNSVRHVLPPYGNLKIC